jgi:hypothetical protein
MGSTPSNTPDFREIKFALFFAGCRVSCYNSRLFISSSVSSNPVGGSFASRSFNEFTNALKVCACSAVSPSDSISNLNLAATVLFLGFTFYKGRCNRRLWL